VDLFEALWPGLLLIALVALLTTTAIVMWRAWPIVAGAVRKRDALPERLRKWNDHVAPLLRRRAKLPVEILPAATFDSAATGQTHGLAVWRLLPALLPDVEFLALAEPLAGEGEAPQVRAVIEAAALRELLGDAVRRQTLWGHVAFLYVWPKDVDLDAAAGRLTSVEAFTARHGVDVRTLAKGMSP
jgi:hypothetical protein